MSLEHVLQNIETLQRNLLKFKENKDVVGYLKQTYGKEISRLDLYGARAEELKELEGSWLRSFDNKDYQPIIYWRMKL